METETVIMAVAVVLTLSAALLLGGWWIWGKALQ